MANECILSEVILRTFLSRRANLEAMGAGLTLIGARSDPPTRRLLEALRRNRLAVTWLDLDANTQADAPLIRLAIPKHTLPIILLPGRPLLRTTLIENYRGFPAGLPGAELTARAVPQARISTSTYASAPGHSS